MDLIFRTVEQLSVTQRHLDATLILNATLPLPACLEPCRFEPGKYMPFRVKYNIS